VAEVLCQASFSLTVSAFVSCPAGQFVEFNVTVVNTGNLRLKNVELHLPATISNNMTCTIGSAPFVSSSSVLEPKAQLLCRAGYLVTTADIEAEPQELSVSVAAMSAVNSSITATKNLTLTAVRMPQLAVTVDNCSATPTMPGGAGMVHAA